MVFAVTGGTQATGYEISNSLRFNDDDSAYLSRTPSSAGNRRTFTYSGWLKPAVASATSRTLIGAGANSGTNDYSIFQSGNKLRFSFATEGSGDIITDGVFRDPAAWYHIVWAIDTTQSTASNRVKLYINGTQETNVSGTYPDQDYQTSINNTVANVVGARSYSTTSYYDGYMADVHLIDGQALAPTEFGETNDNGVWIPKQYTGSYGTNGFKLEFKQTGTSANSSGMGADTSGNDHHFTPTNLAAIDVTEDTPTNNFCTLNPIDPVQGAAYSEGNCKTVTNSSNRNYVTGTFGLTSGKWYWEAKLTAVTADAVDQAFFGIADLDDRGVNSTGESLGDRANEVGWHQEEGKYQRNNSFSSAHTASWGIGDICAIALDADNNRVTIAKNGQWADGSGNADQSSPTAFVTYTASTMTPAMGEGGGGTEATWECNFGNSAFSISSGNSDANGYGNFEYAVPSGYYALCTKNLAEYG